MSALRSLKRARRMCSRNSYCFSASFCSDAAARKKRPLPQRKICDKSLKRTHDIGHCCRDDAAMQRPAGKSLDRRAALYSPLSFLLIPETAASVKGENAVLRKNSTVKRPTGKIRGFSRLANYKCFFALNRQSTTGTSSPNSCGRKRGQTFSVMQMTEAARRLPISQDSASVLP